ncbi:hypothetical protein EYF80_031127 [Liparis tanakae]|uniref:Uncharacterized protein n=1 Tax=Liparis tanakae TaxID=230148 RepID=A0A4Z2H1C0_9TELE|nr:hypothetical protein EYF80_031127 [Liparis tanakae]
MPLWRNRAGSERDALPLIEEASRDQLGALEPEEPYMAREPDVKYLKGALQGKSYISKFIKNFPHTAQGHTPVHGSRLRIPDLPPPLCQFSFSTKESTTHIDMKEEVNNITRGGASRPTWPQGVRFSGGSSVTVTAAAACSAETLHMHGQFKSGMRNGGPATSGGASIEGATAPPLLRF